MSQSANRDFQIQCRQQPSGSDFSLNTAAAMNVGGDRVAIYANGAPDGFSHSPIRINGVPVNIENRTHYLRHGGTIKKSGRNYLVTWPTGETASFDMRRTGNMGFLNIGVQVYPCSQNGYEGLLGNANGNRRDDFSSSPGNPDLFGGVGMSDDMKRRRRAFLAKEFAEAWRINDATSMFDYGMGESTLTYTDRSFPRVHRTINDLPNDRRMAARRACEARGLRGRELEACIFDNGYLKIAPTPRPVVRPHPRDVAFGKVDREEPNVNPSGITTIGAKESDVFAPPTTTTRAIGQKEVKGISTTKPGSGKGDMNWTPAPANKVKTVPTGK